MKPEDLGETLNKPAKVSVSKVSCPYKIHSAKQAILNLDLQRKKTRTREFLEQMEQVVYQAELVSLIAPYYPEGRKGRPTFAMESMQRAHFMQHSFTQSDPAMAEAFIDVPMFREFCPVAGV